MIKIVLITTAIIVVMLSIYTYSNKVNIAIVVDDKNEKIESVSKDYSNQVKVSDEKIENAPVPVKGLASKKPSSPNDTTFHNTVTLNETQLKIIESEVNGEYTVHLTEEQLIKIESEVNSKNTIKLSDSQIKRIESEVSSPTSVELSNIQLKKIESEVNNKSSVKLSDELLKKIEHEVKTTL